MVLDAAGEPVVASPEGPAVFDRSTGTMAFDKRPANAALYRVDGGQVTCAAGGLTICNGPAFDEPQGRVYLADTVLFVVELFDLDPETGGLAGRRRFLDFGEA